MSLASSVRHPGLYGAAFILCIAHAVTTSGYALRELHGIVIIVPLLLLSLLTWLLVWPVVIWKTGARRRFIVVPLLLGFVALIPAFFYALLDVMPWRM